MKFKTKIYAATLAGLMTFSSIPALAAPASIPPGQAKKQNQVVVNIAPAKPLTTTVAVTSSSYDPRRYALDLYQHNKKMAFGLKYQFQPDYFVTSNLELNRHTNDMILSLGAQYRIPQSFLLWNFYVGGEYTMTPVTFTGDPYLKFGTDFLFFFSEVKYPFLPTGNATSRGGLRFYF